MLKKVSRWLIQAGRNLLTWVRQEEHMKQRIISVLLVFSILLTMLPATAFAESAGDSSDKAENPFSDVSGSDWFYDSVMYALTNGLFSGVSADRFDPQGTMTRAMYVTVMGRMAAADTAAYAGEAVFEDVNPAAWYGPYVAWAYDKGIVIGVGNGTFHPEDLVTREQMAVMIVRFFDAHKIVYPEKAVSIVPADLNATADYAREAVLKLWGCGLFQGDDAGNFNPGKNASRAEAATFCMRIHQVAEQWLTESGKKPDQTEGYTYYRLTFETNGGSKVDGFSRRRDATLNALPTPYKASSIFYGWCYDQELTQLVADSDTVSKNLVLYAKWGEMGPLEENETQAFARTIDTTEDFDITINAPSDWTAEQVRQAITVRNISSIEEREWIKVTRQGDAFVISGVNYAGTDGAQQPGFVAGANYKLTLDDDALSFEGQDTATREYHFTIAKEAVMNVSLNEDMIYIPASDLSDLVVNGVVADEISIAVITVGQDGSTTQKGAQTVGSFTYTERELTVGDTVAIYAGDEIPTMESSEAGDDISFVEITAVDGTTYDYQGAAMEDVLFMPDVLPVPLDADTDGDSGNHSITVPVEVMTYTDDKYERLELTSQTTVDKGDFIAFYSGTLEDSGAGAAMEGYAEIETAAQAGGNYIIVYHTVTQEEMMEAMAAYRKEQLEGEDLLEGVDTADIERSVEQQARDSGFAEEAGMYLAAMALETDSFTKLSDDFELSDYSVTMPDGASPGAIAMARGSDAKVDVELTTLQATISTDLVHFEDLSGLRLTLTVGVEITIHGPKGDIVIEISGSFEQEVKIDLGVDGKAVWKWWAIFPYIAEYEVSAWVDLYTFTGIGVQATLTSAEADDDDGMGTGDEDIEDIGEQIKKLMDEKDKYLGDGEGTVASTLEEKYADMLENESDWVELFSKDILRQHFRIILIIDIEFAITFVVSANMNISLGLDFWYENAKRYMYTVEIFSGNVINETIDLVEEHYEFEFYVMGTMGLRAGIRASIAVGLISTKLASVGFAAEAGVYARLWGYFYYQLVYRANATPQKTTYYAGALLFELGIYLEITFEAQAFNGTFSYNPTLYENEWPLWSVGMRENIREFAYDEEDVPELAMKKNIRASMAPDSLFEMAYLDLKTGDDDSKIFDDSTKYFSVEMTNDQFTYDRASNRLSVNPTEGDINLDGEMVITWINQPLAFSSASIQRRIPLHWDNLNDGYAILFQCNGGSSIPLLVARYDEEIKPPENPVKKGYVFDGWYTDEHLTQPGSVPATMPNRDMELYAKWVPATDTVYRVEHYGEVLGRTQYELLETESMQGATDETVNLAPKSYRGYVTPAAQTLTIAPDGSAVLRYYYDLQTHKVTFDPGVAQGETVVTTLKYGAPIVAPVFSSKGYSFADWDAEVQPYMLDQDLTYVAQWQVGSDTPYRVEYYVEQPDGRMALQRLEEKTGATGEAVDAAMLLDGSYLVENGIDYRDVTVSGQQAVSPVITEDGKLIIKVNYARISHTITYDSANGEAETETTYRYGARIAVPADPARAGYTFLGWDEAIPATMPAEQLRRTAQWRANENTAYVVEHYQQNANDDSYTLTDTHHLTGTTDTEAVAVEKTYEHFTPVDAVRGNIDGDGSLVLKIYYIRETYTVNYQVDGEVYAEQQTYKYGQTVSYPNAPEKEGYNFGYWGLGGASFGGVMPAENLTLSAEWLALTDYAYTVNYYRQGLAGGANVLVRSERPTGEFDSEVTVTPADEYEGFTAPAAQTVIIVKDLVVELIYARNQYALDWDFAGGTAANKDAYTKAGDVEFETPIVIPLLERAGYTYQWDTAVAAKMGVEALSYTALWTANRFTLKFNPNGGAGDAIADMDFVYDEEQALPLCALSRTGYTFEGWALTAEATEAAYQDGVTVRNLTANPDGSVTLYAVWSPDRYALHYELDGGVNSAENHDFYTVEDNVALGDPTKTGYTFGGWYWDAALTSPVASLAIAAGSTGSSTFYAKWTANSFAVVFHKNIGDGTTKTQIFTYDQAPTALESAYTREGYIFAGWSTGEDGGGALYADGQMVQNLAESGSVNLYAKWTPVVYDILYVMAGGNNDHDNPGSYTVETGDITLKAPTRATGYTFLGWYDGAGNQVTVITRGTMKTLTLTARWGYAGSFTVTNNGSNTFTITRGGSGLATDQQNYGQQIVYFRTVGGTAVGGTHFDHQGGAAAGLTFSDGENQKTVTITEHAVTAQYTKDGYTYYPSTAYSNINRTYGFELVKVVGGGVLGGAAKATRTMARDAAYSVPGGFYAQTTFYGGEEKITVDHWGASNYEWDARDAHHFSTNQYLVEGVSYAGIKPYWIATADNVSADVSIDFDEKYSCWIGFKLTEYQSFDDQKASTTFDSAGVDRRSQHAILSTATAGISSYYGAKGGIDNMFYAKWPQYTLKVVDTREPRMIGTGLMPDGAYKAGETVTISVVFDEIVANANGATITGTNLSGSWACTGGAGSNVLTFTGQLSQDCTDQTLTNGVTLSGTPLDMAN